MKQYMIYHENIEKELIHIFQEKKIKRLFIVGGKFVFRLPFFHSLKCVLEKLEIQAIYFTDFSPNPKYEQVVAAVNFFCQKCGQFLLAIGGGSSIDVAKCIKLFAGLDTSQNLLEQEMIPNHVPLMAVPTTAGTGSEATQFAVLYKDGEKISISHEDGLPQYVVLDPHNLSSLSLYQKKVTLCDALSHAIESGWSVRSTVESRALSKKAIPMILRNMEGYLDNDFYSCGKMLEAANIAGHAINITTTTAAHAMSYKITSMYGVAHGHAVILCLPEVWEYMWKHLDTCTDKRGSQYVRSIMIELAEDISQGNPDEAIRYLKQLRKKLELQRPDNVLGMQLQMMVQSVNKERLSGSPVNLDSNAIEAIYKVALWG